MKIVIIEDEESASFRLKKLLEEIDPNATIAAILESVEEGVEWFKSNPEPDLVFADIQLADGVSFTIFEQVTISCPVIFITAYDDHAIKAFKLNSIDYLLKPLKRNELEAALAKYHKQKKPAFDLNGLNTLIKNIASGKQGFQKRLLVKYGATIQMIDVKDCAYFYSEEKITFVKLFDTRNYSIDHTLDELEQLLEPSEFFRANRQVILNIKAIKKMEAYSKSRVKVFPEPPSDFEIIVSTEKSPQFKAWLIG